jgi:fructosamine-3-kinase
MNHNECSNSLFIIASVFVVCTGEVSYKLFRREVDLLAQLREVHQVQVWEIICQSISNTDGEIVVDSAAGEDRWQGTMLTQALGRLP